MKIRLMCINDYKQVFELWKNTAGVGLRSIDDSEPGIEKFLMRNANTNFVAIENNKIIGIILSGHDGRRAYIYHTAVNSKFRGHGIGTKLLEAVYSALEKEGITKAALVVYENNEIGNSFWKSKGWEKRMDLNYYNKSLNRNNR